MEKLSSYIKKNKHRIVNLSEVQNPFNETDVIGYAKDNSAYFLLLPYALVEACGASAKLEVLRILRRSGYLHTQANSDDDKRLKGRMGIQGTRVGGYLLCSSLLNASDWSGFHFRYSTNSVKLKAVIKAMKLKMQKAKASGEVKSASPGVAPT